MRISILNYNEYNHSNNTNKIENTSLRIENTNIKQSCFNNNHAQALRIQNLYNLSFKGGKQEAIYAIDDEFNCRKFRNQKTAAKELEMEKSVAAISACITGRRNKGNGLYFVRASEVETETENGEKILDIEKVKKAINKRAPIRAIYAIDKYGNYQKFDSQVAAAKKLNLNVSLIQIGRNLHSEGIFSSGYTFVYPEEIEVVDEQENTSVSEEKVKDIIDNIEEKISYFYGIDKDGHYKKYKLRKEAAYDLGLNCNTSKISSCLSGDTLTAGGYVFVFPEEIEITQSDGRKKVDITRVQNIVEDRLTNKNALYAIDRFGNYKKFEKATDAKKELGFPPKSANISLCLNGYQKSTHGYTFVRAIEVERKDENGTVIIDEKKIKEIAISRFGKHPNKQTQRFINQFHNQF